MEEAVGALGLPVFVKPANLGSSIGVAKVSDVAALGDAVLAAFEFDDHVILEEFVRGRELELAAHGQRGRRVSKAGEIIASREFYDYDDKYVLGTAETIAPDRPHGRAAGPRRSTWRSAAYRALRVEGLARVDLFLPDDDEIVVNEVNTMPGFTPISMFPMLWEAEGVSVPGRRRGAGHAGAGPARPPAPAAHAPGSLRAQRPGGAAAGRRAASRRRDPGSTRST